MSAAFADLLQDLDRLAERGQRATFWLRDDDAVAPSPALDRLLALGVPVTLAVIPAGAEMALAARMAQEPAVEVAVHGWAHVNHARAGAKSCELGADRPPALVLAEVSRGLARVKEMFGPQAVPVLVPPWNRIAPEVVAALPDAGFAALSVFGPEVAGAPRRINAHVDLIDWRGTRGGWPTDVLEAALRARLRAAGDRHIGVLGHHLVHDEGAWDALSGLITLTRHHPGCEWVSLSCVLDRSGDP